MNLKERYYRELNLRDDYKSDLSNLENEKLLLEQAIDRIERCIKTKKYAIEMQDKIISKIEEDLRNKDGE